MFNLIKYELKGYYKDFIIILGAIAILNLLLFTRTNIWPKEGIYALSLLITFAAMVVVFIWNIRVFGRDMYEDSGYLIFTLPEKGYSILGGKLLTSIIQMVIVGIVALLFNYINFQNIPNWKSDFYNIVSNINVKLIVFGIFTAIVQYIYFLTTIYFSISLSKVAIKKKKMGKMGAFIIFVILSIVIGKISEILIKAFPQTFDINIFSAQTQLTLYGPHVIPINISVVIFDIILFIVMFIAASYIMENKLDF